MPNEKTWRDIAARFNPSNTEEDPSRWAERSYSPIRTVVDDLTLNIGDGRFLLLGTTGTGKTTELLRAARECANDFFVVYLDVLQHFEKVVGDERALQQVQPWELYVLIGLAVHRAAKERLSESGPENWLEDLEKVWRKLAEKSGTESIPLELDLAKLSKNMIVLASTIANPTAGVAAIAALEAAEKIADGTGYKWRMPFGQSRKSIPNQDPELDTVQSLVNQLLAWVSTKHHPVLLILDGLDRLALMDSARAVFIHSTMLGKLASKVIVCGPFVLRHNRETDTVYGLEPRVLANAPVLDRNRPTDSEQPGTGVKFFEELFALRVKDLDVSPAQLVSSPALRRLAYRSGGRARDFVRLIHTVANAVLRRNLKARRTKSAEHWECTEEDLKTGENDLYQRRAEGLNSEHRNILEAVLADPRHELPSFERKEVATLLTTNCLLPYPNEREWFFPHPILLHRYLQHT